MLMRVNDMYSYAYNIHSRAYGIRSDEYGLHKPEYGMYSPEYGLHSRVYGVIKACAGNVQSSNPVCIHQHDAPAVGVFKSSALLLPVRIFRREGKVARAVQPLGQAFNPAWSGIRLCAFRMALVIAKEDYFVLPLAINNRMNRVFFFIHNFSGELTAIQQQVVPGLLVHTASQNGLRASAPSDGRAVRASGRSTSMDNC